jgi:hypothetical protein
VQGRVFAVGTGCEWTVTPMVEYSNDMLLGSAIQLIQDLHDISFLGDKQTCTKIYNMTKEWLELLEVRIDG